MILIFPPYFREVEKPFVNMPCLSGYLKANGISVTAIDANISFFHYFLEKPGLQYLKEAADSEFLLLELHHSALNYYEAHRYAEISDIACTPMETLEKITQTAINVMHSEAYYDRTQYKVTSSLIQKIVHSAVVLSESLTDTLVPYASKSAIKAVLDQTEHNLYRKFYKDKILPQIISANDTHVCLMLDFNSQLIPAMVFSKLLKEECANVEIYAVGDICPHLYDACKRMPEILTLFDGIITHNYETVLLDICHNKQKQKLQHFLYFDGNLIIEQKSTNELLQCVHGAPDYNDDLLRYYFAPETELTVYTGNGCYWAKCAFCNIHVRSIKHCEKTIDEVLNEITALQRRYDVNLIAFGDEEIRADRLLQIAKGLINKGISIKWTAQSRFDFELQQEDYNQIYQSGCIYIGFGLESGDDNMLTKMCTGFQSDTAERILEKAHKSGIMTNVSVVVGFPGETDAQWSETIKFLKKNTMYISSILPLCYSFTKHSSVEKDRTRFGVCDVYDEHKADALLFTYPNYVDTFPNWKIREERILQIYSTPELQAQLLREKYPRGHYVSHGEQSTKVKIQRKYKLKLLHYDILNIRLSQKYHFSGDQGVDLEKRFTQGNYWYLHDEFHCHWIAISEQEAVIFQNMDTNGDVENLAQQLHVSRERAYLMCVLFQKKYHDIIYSKFEDI